MNNTWLPGWIGALWSAATVVVLAVHVGHVISMSGRRRIWHAAHVLMALGMLDMFWPGTAMPIRGGAAEGVFVAAAVIAALFLSDDLARRRGEWLAWLLVAADLLIMAYMYAVPTHAAGAITFAGTGWLLIEAVGWAGGRFDRPDADLVAPPPPDFSRTVATLPVTRQTVGTRRVRHVSLVLMNLGMAYMLLAAHFGATVTMPGMSM